VEAKKKTELCQLDLLARVISFIISPQVAGCTKAAHQAKQCHAACDERKTPGKNNAMQRAKEKHHASAQTKKKTPRHVARRQKKHRAMQPVKEKNAMRPAKKKKRLVRVNQTNRTLKFSIFTPLHTLFNEGKWGKLLSN
jgi:hypothetical protein